MPIEKAEKAIDKLKSKYESLDNVYGAITGGGSTLGHLQDQIKKIIRHLQMLRKIWIRLQLLETKQSQHVQKQARI